MAKMSLEDLRKLRNETQQQIKKRETDDKIAQVIVGMGTCGIAAGAKLPRRVCKGAGRKEHGRRRHYPSDRMHGNVRTNPPWKS